MRVLEIRGNSGNGNPLKGFADIETDSGIVIREFRIVLEENKRPRIVCPQISWRHFLSGEIRYKTIVSFPNQLKGEIDLLILNAWNREKENAQSGKGR